MGVARRFHLQVPGVNEPPPEQSTVLEEVRPSFAYIFVAHIAIATYRLSIIQNWKKKNRAFLNQVG
jgi:hypothetical protein